MCISDETETHKNVLDILNIQYKYTIWRNNFLTTFNIPRNPYLELKFDLLTFMQWNLRVMDASLWIALDLLSGKDKLSCDILEYQLL